MRFPLRQWVAVSLKRVDSLKYGRPRTQWSFPFRAPIESEADPKLTSSIFS